MADRTVKVLMYEHTGNRNRGCEAIIRSTCDLLRRPFPKCAATVISHDPRYDSQSKIPGVKEFIPLSGYREWTPAWFIGGVSKRFRIDRMVAIPDQLQRTVQHSDICMSIGGDMYCYKEYYPSYMISVDSMAKRAGKPLVLWGASLAAELITKEIRADLESFDLITVRESISYETLDGLGINTNLHLYPDPAFTMQKEDVGLPANWVVGNTIGINISPLIMRYESDPGSLMKAMIALIDYIMANTDSVVALIPHVFVRGGNDDTVPLQEINERFKDTGRVLLIGVGYSAPALKGLISQCRLFVGARTHATIAAYSSCVPTLALGYSVKSRGIARDIFGAEEGLVLPIQGLSSEGLLIASFNELIERETELRRRLGDIIPGYVNQARSAAEQVRSLF